MDTAQAHTDTGQPTITDRDRHLNCQNLKQLVLTCDFEAKVGFVLGLNTKKPYRLVELPKSHAARYRRKKMSSSSSHQPDSYLAFLDHWLRLVSFSENHPHTGEHQACAKKRPQGKLFAAHCPT